MSINNGTEILSLIFGKVNQIKYKLMAIIKLTIRICINSYIVKTHCKSEVDHLMRALPI